MSVSKMSEDWIASKFDEFSDDELGKFDRISNPLHTNQRICGLMYLYNMRKFEAETPTLQAIEGGVYIMDISDFGDDITDEDIKNVLRCGFTLVTVDNVCPYE